MVQPANYDRWLLFFVLLLFQSDVIVAAATPPHGLCRSINSMNSIQSGIMGDYLSPVLLIITLLISVRFWFWALGLFDKVSSGQLRKWLPPPPTGFSIGLPLHRLQTFLVPLGL